MVVGPSSRPGVDATGNATMSSLGGAIRFVVGASMVAAGAVLVAPLGTVVAKRVNLDSYGGARPQPMPASSAVMAVPAVSAAPAAGPAAAVSTPWAEQPAVGPPPPLPRSDYAPPPPPSQLPPAPAALAAPSPALGGTYRSTLEMPPPPLLDGQQPPPLAVSWSAPTGHQAPTAARMMPPALVPATYTIRDGDDLTAIATRFYGHPAAAAAVWSANRETVPDPDLLPIGVELRLPPPWTIRTDRAAGSIEPPALTPERRLDPTPAPAAASQWLDPQQPRSAPTVPAPTAGGSVRVAPGETLASLGQRFYGTSAAAQRIWEANQDRLRSPDLLVAGMELRLP